MNVYKSVLIGGEGSGGGVPIDSFEITTLPTKTEYLIGDNLDLKGMVVTATAKGMTGNVVNNCTFSPTSFPVEGSFNVNCSYYGASDNFSVIVTEKPLPNNIPAWLNYGGIHDKEYTTIQEVLADTDTLQTLISSHNAVDYMVMSTAWCSAICADATAMTYIGADNYCADSLLADSTWRNAICTSSNFTKVLNVSSPYMTSNTAPSGEVSASSQAYSPAWYAFSTNQEHSNYSGWVQYKFTQNVTIYRIDMTTGPHSYRGGCIQNVQIKSSIDNSNFTTVKSFLNTNTNPNVQITQIVDTISSGVYWRIHVLDTYLGGFGRLYKCKFYGRAATT